LAWRRRRAAGDHFLAVAAIFVVVFFSISTEKRDLYVLPAFPAIALLIASLVAAAGRRRDGREASPVDPRWVTVAQVVIGAVLGLAGLAVPVAVGRYPQVSAMTGLLLGAVLLLTGAATVWQALRRRLLGSVLAPAAGMLVLYLLVPPLLYPAFEPIKSARPLAVEVRRVTAASRAAGHAVVAYDVGNLPVAIAFYSDGVYTRETLDPAVLTAHLESSARVYALVNARSLDAVPPSVRDRMVVIDRANLAHRPVLFVANR
jgi:4-amino-4-deoxy-L-arabinose transferase-like glycosyltransferase